VIHGGENPRVSSSALHFFLGFLSQRIGVGSWFLAPAIITLKLSNGDLWMVSNPLQSTVIINCMDDSFLGGRLMKHRAVDC